MKNHVQRHYKRKDKFCPRIQISGFKVVTILQNPMRMHYRLSGSGPGDQVESLNRFSGGDGLRQNSVSQ